MFKLHTLLISLLHTFDGVVQYDWLHQTRSVTRSTLELELFSTRLIEFCSVSQLDSIHSTRRQHYPEMCDGFIRTPSVYWVSRAIPRAMAFGSITINMFSMFKRINISQRVWCRGWKLINIFLRSVRLSCSDISSPIELRILVHGRFL